MTTHPLCGKSWTGNKPEHCPVCCITFSSTSAGDKHRVGGWSDPEDLRRCLTPEVVGLVLRDQGGPVWGWPSDEKALQRLRQTPTAIENTDEVPY